MLTERENQIIHRINREEQREFFKRSPYRFDWKGVGIALLTAAVLAGIVLCVAAIGAAFDLWR